MNKISKYSFVVIILWLGFVISISFMEAPVKFTAPSLSLAAGLDVGMRVFGVLNKIEIVFALLVGAALLTVEQKRKFVPAYTTLAAVLLLQTFWLLPELNKRALIIISGSVPEHSNIHFFYVAVEIIKVICLIYLTVMFIKYYRRPVLKIFFGLIYETA